MKKFFKWSAIIAGILMVIGLVLGFASSVIGGRQAVISIGEGLKEVEWDELYNVLKSVDGLEFNVNEGGLNISLNGEGAAELIVNGKTISAGKQKESFASAEIKKLDLSLGAGKFVIREKDTEAATIDLTITGAGTCDYYVEEGTLIIEGFRNSFGIGNNTVSEMILEIPAGLTFEEVDAEAGAGIMDIGSLQVRDLETVIGAGELKLEKIRADEFSAQIGAGKLIAKEMDVQDAEIDVSLGECVFEGWIKGNLEAECDMGNMELKFKGEKSDHNYEIECAMGNIDMEDYGMAAFMGEKHIDNGADSEFNISCNMGNISIDFEEE